MLLHCFAAQLYEFANTSAVLGGACAAANAAAPYKCLFGQYRYPYLETPWFASESQFDNFLVRNPPPAVRCPESAASVR